MKHTHFIVILMTTVIMLSFAACGGTHTETETKTESGQSANETDITQNAVYYQEEYGLVIKQWTQPYQMADSRLVDTYALASGFKDFNVYHLLMCEFSRTDDPDDSCIASLGYVVFSTNPDSLQKQAEAVAAVNEYRIACGDEPIDYTLEKFTTSNGRILWVRQLPEPEIIQGEPTEEEEVAIDAMHQGFADQIAQIELVDAKPIAVTSKVSFTTVDLNGNKVNSSVFANAELTLVNIWGSYCPYSIGEMDDLMKLDEEMKDLQVITILGDSNSVDDEAASDAREVVDELNLTFPVYITNDEINDIFPYYAFPTSFLVDREGNPVGVAYIGDATKDKFSEWIQYSTNIQTE